MVKISFKIGGDRILIERWTEPEEKEEE